MTRLTLRIDFDQDHQLGPGKVRLLELVGEHGSIAAACRAMNMSYNCAWLLIRSMNQMFTEPLVAAPISGIGGGKVGLTAMGRQVFACFRAIEAQAALVVTRELSALERVLVADQRSSV